MEGTVEQIQTLRSEKSGNNYFKITVNGETFTGFDRPTYQEGDKIRYDVVEKPSKDGQRVFRNLKNAVPVQGPRLAPTAPTAAPPTTPTIPTGAYLDAAVAIASKKVKFTDVMSAYLAIVDMVENPDKPDKDEPEPDEEETDPEDPT